MKALKLGKEFRWIGEGIPSQRRKSQINYRSFCFGNHIYQIGDFVVIQNDAADNPKDLMQCYVAEIHDLYDTGVEHESHLALVQWYSRISEFPRRILRLFGDLDSQYEVVEEKGPQWSDIIEAKTIFDKCQVLFLPVDTNYKALVSKFKENDIATFFCRYIFTGTKVLPKVKLEAGHLSAPETVRYTPKSVNGISPMIEKVTPINGWKTSHNKPVKSNDLYYAVPTGTSTLPKVLIKNLDIGIDGITNGNARIFVSDPETATVDSITSKFMNKLSLNSKSNEMVEIDDFHIVCNMKTAPNKRENLNGVISSPNSLKLTPSREVNQKRSGLFKRKTSKISSLKECTNELSTPKKTPKTEEASLGPSPEKKFRAFTEKSIHPVENAFSVTRSGRKVKSVNYTEQKVDCMFVSSSKQSSKFSKLLLSNNMDEDSDVSVFSASEKSLSDCSLSDDHSKYPSSKKIKTPVIKKSGRKLNIPDRKTPLKTPKNVLEESRQRLHVSSVPKSLPCREEEYSDIYIFVKGCLCAHTGGCMYISGVPGTGKTATVHEVIQNLENERESGDIPIFSFVEVNGMWMTDPYQCYVHIYKSLSGKTIAPQQAASLLEKRFTEPGPTKDAVVLLVDELDRLWTRKQTVMYNIFDWPTKKHSKLIVLAIANTMDLPERLMMNRIASRVGLTRKTFQPYNFRQLQEIIMSRIKELNAFDPDAVQLVARKVAAVSGDARRALDICRFATEVVSVPKSSAKHSKVLVGMEHVDIAIQQMFSSPLISAIKSSSCMAKIFFRCILSEFSRTGSEETTLLKIYQQIVAICRFEGLSHLSSSEVSSICAQLASSHLILVDNFQNDLHMKIRLNVSSDDVTYALKGK